MLPVRANQRADSATITFEGCPDSCVSVAAQWSTGATTQASGLDLYNEEITYTNKWWWLNHQSAIEAAGAGFGVAGDWLQYQGEGAIQWQSSCVSGSLWPSDGYVACAQSSQIYYVPIPEQASTYTNFYTYPGWYEFGQTGASWTYTVVPGTN